MTRCRARSTTVFESSRQQLILFVGGKSGPRGGPLYQELASPIAVNSSMNKQSLPVGQSQFKAHFQDQQHHHTVLAIL
jgi:hypothetical protein